LIKVHWIVAISQNDAQHRLALRGHKAVATLQTINVVTYLLGHMIVALMHAILLVTQYVVTQERANQITQYVVVTTAVHRHVHVYIVVLEPMLGQMPVVE
jgi:hypothetical protein